MTGSLLRSSNSISATPGPSPRTVPANASLSRSCPAPYSLSRLATSVVRAKTSHAAPWIFSLSTPCWWVMISAMSSPTRPTR